MARPAGTGPAGAGHVRFDVGRRRRRRPAEGLIARRWQLISLPIAGLVSEYQAGWTIKDAEELPSLLRDVMSRPGEWKKRSDNALRLVRDIVENLGPVSLETTRVSSNMNSQSSRCRLARMVECSLQQRASLVYLRVKVVVRRASGAFSPINS